MRRWVIVTCLPQRFLVNMLKAYEIVIKEMRIEGKIQKKKKERAIGGQQPIE